MHVPADRPTDGRPTRARGGRLKPARAARAAAVLGAAVLAGSGAVGTAGAAADTTLSVVRDSVVVAGQPAGPATIQVTRPDALTGRPVVIGQFSGTAQGLLPFTVNTSSAGPLGGADCWQQGALPSALTPDIRPGDTVKVTTTPDPAAGGSPTTLSMTVPTAKTDGPEGPIPDCRTVAPFAQNLVTSAPAQIGADPIAISGAIQPLATAVSAALTDGAHSAPLVDGTLGAGGTWSATIPAAQVAGLADGALTLTPIFAVPDVSTGAPAHIAGPPVLIRKATATAPTAPAGGVGPLAGRGPAAGGAARRALRVGAVRLPASVSLATARRRGLRASFVVPTGAAVVRVRLGRGGRTVFDRVVRAGRPGTRQTVQLSGARLRQALRPGRYTLGVTAGASSKDLGTPVQGVFRVH